MKNKRGYRRVARNRKKILVLKYFRNMKDFEILDVLKISRKNSENEEKQKIFKDKITQFIFNLS